MIKISVPWEIAAVIGWLAIVGLVDLGSLILRVRKQQQTRREHGAALRTFSRRFDAASRFPGLLDAPHALRDQVVPIAAASGHHCTITMETAGDDRQAFVVTCDHPQCAGYFSVGSLGQAHADSLAITHEGDPNKYPLLNLKRTNA